MLRAVLGSFFAFGFFGFSLVGAEPTTTPPEGLRENTPRVFALTNAKLVLSPGNTIEKGTLVIREGVIEAVGANAAVPADATVLDMKGKTIYPGLIDSYSDWGLPKPPQRTPGGPGRRQRAQPEQQEVPRGPRYWNPNVLAHQKADKLFSADEEAAGKLREQGITTVLSVPTKGIFKGASALVNLGEGKPNDLIIKPIVAQHISLQTNSSGDDYPNSLMGAIALIRQTLLDAGWYRQAQAAWSRNPKLVRPEVNEALEALNQPVGTYVIEAGDELDFLRAAKIGKEFTLPVIVRGSGTEYLRLDAIKAAGLPVILPVNFPDPPSVENPDEAVEVTLRELRLWDEAPENPKRLAEAKIPFAFTSATLKDPGNFLKNVKKAVERGLAKNAALAALTTAPARLFGVENKLGTLSAGKAANLVITDGELFAEKTKIRETWVDGKRYEIKPDPLVDVRGKWNLTLSTGAQGGDTVLLDLKGEADGPEGNFKIKKEAKLSKVNLSGKRLVFSFTGDSVGFKGVVRMGGNVSADEILGTGELADGSAFTWQGKRIAPFVPEPDTSKAKKPEMASFPPVYPAAEFGRPKTPEQPENVLVKGATIWTSGPQGILENADMLVRRGKIVRIGKNLSAPSGASVIDANGKHLTPGLIDCHSHTGISGNVNESGQTITAEVKIGDVVDPDDISLYRQLAGGLTAANQLHGSANAIGGQNQVIKLRWGVSDPEEMKFEGAIPGIKFALGENPKQSNWGDQYTTRYPQTRMGVEQIIRDAFKAGQDYQKDWADWAKNKNRIPPRRDLELETISEILQKKRLVHSHSYRQDEILMLMRVAADFGFTIGTFQHVLEGYKVADEMARLGIGASCFSDWWAYKFEVYDAIPYNGKLMHDAGVVVSFNSDSDELARRLNLEAAKAVKYGGLPPAEALKFVTLNPAKQLRIDGRVGSLESGKDADFVLWSQSPLSTYTVCEQTWVDGRKYFDREEDSKLRAEITRQRALLVQKILADKKSPKDGSGEKGGWKRPGERKVHNCMDEEVQP
ncbi:MAG: amidohydrolase family protein [candidate division Zixibacteria bacterium]|nr:amidohydrolase family protein [candidate division Zixibacteria bacterium]